MLNNKKILKYGIVKNLPNNRILYEFQVTQDGRNVDFMENSYYLNGEKTQLLNTRLPNNNEYEIYINGVKTNQNIHSVTYSTGDIIRIVTNEKNYDKLANINFNYFTVLTQSTYTTESVINIKNITCNVSNFTSAYLLTEHYEYDYGVDESFDYIAYNTLNLMSTLETANFPNLKKIPAGMFAGCSNLKSVSFPSCQYINDYSSDSYNFYTPLRPYPTYPQGTFEKCSSLTSVSFPKCKEINCTYAFADCTSLRNISFPMCQKITGFTAFGNCTSLDYIELPECSLISRILSFQGLY